jgi:hypothetical protein
MLTFSEWGMKIVIFDSEEYTVQISSYKREFLEFMKQEKIKLLFLKTKFEQLGFSNSLSNITASDYLEFDGENEVAKTDIMHTLNSGLMITTCGRFEYHLVLLCKVIQRVLDIGISHKEMQGQGVRNVANYLEPLLKLEINKSPEYKRVIDWLKVRNLLTHNYGTAETDSEFSNIFKVDMSFDHEVNMIFVSMDDCLRLFEDFEKFSLFLFEQLESIIDNSFEV